MWEWAKKVLKGVKLVLHAVDIVHNGGFLTGVYASLKTWAYMLDGQLVNSAKSAVGVYHSMDAPRPMMMDDEKDDFVDEAQCKAAFDRSQKFIAKAGTLLSSTTKLLLESKHKKSNVCGTFFQAILYPDLNAKAAFDGIDADHNGCVDEEELLPAMFAFCALISVKHCSGKVTVLHKLQLARQLSASLLAAVGNIFGVDTKKKGLNYQQFCFLLLVLHLLLPTVSV